MTRHPLLAAALLLAAACGDRGGETAVGTVEMTELDVAPTQPARVVAVRVDEGDTVRAGDTLAVLKHPSAPGDVAGRAAGVQVAEANLRDLLAGARPAEREQAGAALRSAAAGAERARRDLARMRTLADAGAVARRELDAARAASAEADARRDSAREALRLLDQGARRETVQAARGQVAAARAALQSASATSGDLTLVAPEDGVVLGRWTEPGEVVAAGTPVVTLGQPRRPWVRVYVAERMLPRLRVGQTVTARLDGVEDRGFPGRIVAINDRAEYTPRVALTEKERADLVFGVKVELRDTTGMLKAGLPATVTLPEAP
jgi:HlyD family secretion protein